MAKPSSNITRRILSALVLAPVVLAVIYAGTPYFDLMLFMALMAMSFEWVRLVQRKPGWILLGVFYIGLPLVSLAWLRGREPGLDLVLWLFLTVWAVDIGAYVAGSLIGGKKLAPAISPKKTWAGLFGGMISAALLSVFFFPLSSAGSQAAWPVLLPALVGGFFAIVEQAGDLLESSIKRHFKVKDAGNLIPGHGGILDRVDGLTLTAPLLSLLYFCLDRQSP